MNIFLILMITLWIAQIVMIILEIKIQNIRSAIGWFFASLWLYIVLNVGV